MNIPDVSSALIRIQMEYVEMPGLKLTIDQVSRLCGLPIEVGRVALIALTATGFLRRDVAGAYLRSGTAPMHVATIDPHTWTLDSVA